MALLAALAAGLVAPAGAAGGNPHRPSPADASVEGLRVLLTNDDGVQPTTPTDPDTNVGLFELRKALCDAGADVVVVGPWVDRSGASMSITYGSASTRFVADRPTLAPAYADDCGGGDEPAVFGACVVPAGSAASCEGATSLTPADAVTLGVHVVQDVYGWVDGPDLIISGINRGGNDGMNVNISGTVGAATIGSSLGYPSIAMSASSSGTPRAYPDAAAWGVLFVGTLASNDLLPVDYVLNVNYPRVDREPVTRAVWTSVAQESPWGTTFSREGDALSFTSNYGPCSGPRCGDPAPGSDTVAYGSGSIAVSAVSVDRTLGATADSEGVRQLVAAGVFDTVARTADDCKNGGWRSFGYPNQGACVRAVPR